MLLGLYQIIPAAMTLVDIYWYGYRTEFWTPRTHGYAGASTLEPSSMVTSNSSLFHFSLICLGHVHRKQKNGQTHQKKSTCMFSGQKVSINLHIYKSTYIYIYIQYIYIHTYSLYLNGLIQRKYWPKTMAFTCKYRGLLITIQIYIYISKSCHHCFTQ
jgi:hypothetical protein